MKVTIELSERQESFLRQFAANQYEGAPDNLATRTPIFVVERTEELPAPSGYGDGKDKYICSVDGNYYEADKPEDLIKLVTGNEPIPYEEAISALTINVGGESYFIVDVNDYFRAYGIDGAEMIGTHTVYKPIAFFFTLEEAKRYMNGYQAHNCGNCRIYGYGLGYSNNGDMPVFRRLLMDIGQEVLRYDKEGLSVG